MQHNNLPESDNWEIGLEDISEGDINEEWLRRIVGDSNEFNGLGNNSKGDINDSMASILECVRSIIASPNPETREKLSNLLKQIKAFELNADSQQAFNAKEKDSKAKEILYLFLIIVNSQPQFISENEKIRIIYGFWEMNTTWLTTLFSSDENISVDSFADILVGVMKRCKTYPTGSVLHILFEQGPLKNKIITSIHNLSHRDPNKAANLLADLMTMPSVTVDIFLSEINDISLLDNCRKLIAGKLENKLILIPNRQENRLISDNGKLVSFNVSPQFQQLKVQWIEKLQAKVDKRKDTINKMNVDNSFNPFGIAELGKHFNPGELAANNPQSSTTTTTTTTSSTYTSREVEMEVASQSEISISPQNGDEMNVAEPEQQLSRASETVPSQNILNQPIDETIDEPMGERDVDETIRREPTAEGNVNPDSPPIANEPTILNPVSLEPEKQQPEFLTHLQSKNYDEAIKLISSCIFSIEVVLDSIKKAISINSITVSDAHQLLLSLIKDNATLAIQVWQQNKNRFTGLLNKSSDDILFKYFTDFFSFDPNREFTKEILKETQIRNKILYAIAKKENTLAQGNRSTLQLGKEEKINTLKFLNSLSDKLGKFNYDAAVKSWEVDKVRYSNSIIKLDNETLLTKFTAIVMNDRKSELSRELWKEEFIKNKLKNAILESQRDNEGLKNDQGLFAAILKSSSSESFSTYITLMDDSNILYDCARKIELMSSSQEKTCIDFNSKKVEFNKKVLEIIISKMPAFIPQSSIGQTVRASQIHATQFYAQSNVVDLTDDVDGSIDLV